MRGERKWPVLLAALALLHVLLGPAWLLLRWRMHTWQGRFLSEGPTWQEAWVHFWDWLFWDVQFMLTGGFLLRVPDASHLVNHWGAWGIFALLTWGIAWLSLPAVFFLARPAPLWRRALYAVAIAILLSGMGSDNWTSFD